MARHSKTPASETSRATTGDPEHHAVKKTDGEHLQRIFSSCAVLRAVLLSAAAAKRKPIPVASVFAQRVVRLPLDALFVALSDTGYSMKQCNTRVTFPVDTRRIRGVERLEAR